MEGVATDTGRQVFLSKNLIVCQFVFCVKSCFTMKSFHLLSVTLQARTLFMVRIYMPPMSLPISPTSQDHYEIQQTYVYRGHPDNTNRVFIP